MNLSCCLKDTLEGQPMARMCSPTVSIPLLQMLVKLTQAKSVVEVGVFTGSRHYLIQHMQMKRAHRPHCGFGQTLSTDG